MQRSFFCLSISLVVLLSTAFGQGAPAPGTQFRALYNFTGGEDGCCLYGGLARDRDGNLYGVAYIDDNGSGPGELFKLSPATTGYKLQVLHDFSFTDGLCITTPIFDREGNLFGVCTDIPEADGTLWELSHDGTFLVLHTFDGLSDGEWPQDAVALDDAGNIYGTAFSSGPGGAGTLWEYSRSLRTFAVLHAFTNGKDGGVLPSGPRFDGRGKLWGTTEYGPNCYYCGTGTVWSYDLLSGTFSTILDFGSSGVNAPQSRFAIDAAGNLYGTAFGLTVGNCGLVYALERSHNYAPIILHSFTGKNGDGCYAYGNVVFDEDGDLLGTTYNGGDFGDGAIYKLSKADGMWKETTLHSFDLSDGFRPQSGLIRDGEDRWFGTASAGGTYGEGVVFQFSDIE